MALQARVWYLAGSPKREGTDTDTGSTKASDTSKQIQHHPVAGIVAEAEVEAVVGVLIAAVEAVAQGLALAPLRVEAAETSVQCLVQCLVLCQVLCLVLCLILCLNLCLDQHLDQHLSPHLSQLQHHQAQLALRARVGLQLRPQVNQVVKQVMNQYGLTMTKTHVNLALVAKELPALLDQA